MTYTQPIAGDQVTKRGNAAFIKECKKKTTRIREGGIFTGKTKVIMFLLSGDELLRRRREMLQELGREDGLLAMRGEGSLRGFRRKKRPKK